MEIKAIKTRIFRENEDLLQFILEYIKKIPEKSVLVITSKIVALSEGRTVKYESKKQKSELIKKESDFALRTKFVWFTRKNDTIMANAGVDESNGGGRMILSPEDSFASAQKIHTLLCQYFKLKNLGILISDSALLPLRNGVIAQALGYFGFQGLKNYKGKKDIFGKKFIYSKANIADGLATAAALCMGEGDEQQPLALIKDAPVVFTDVMNKRELKINPQEDIYAPLFNKLN